MPSPVHAIMKLIGKILLYYFKFPIIHYIVHIYTLFFSLMFSSLLGYNSTKALEEIRQWW